MPGDRPNLKALSMDPFLQDYEKADDNGEFATMVKETINMSM